jgi:beta-ureidopropionase
MGKNTLSVKKEVSTTGSSKKMTKVAAVQMDGAPGSKEVNLDKAAKLAEEAAKNSAQLVVFQELFSTGYFPTKIDNKFFDLAEDDDGPTITKMKEVARQNRVWLVVPYFEVEKNCIGRYYDSAVVLDPSGKQIGKYRKMHLPNIYYTHEKYYFIPGNLGLPVFNCGDLRLGIIICYDRHYPELVRILVLNGANLVTVPTMTTKKAGRENVWIPELISLAANNHVYVLGVNSTGKQEGKEHFGHTALIDPYGQVVNELGEEEGILYGDVDLSLVKEARNTYNHLRDIRVDVARQLLELLQPQR